MPAKLLVTYATRTGTTEEVALAVARVLRTAGLTADVTAAERVSRVDGYDAVIVGSAVRFGAWLEPAVDFLRRNRGALAVRPVAFFTLHMQDGGGSAAGRARCAAYTALARALVTPRSEAFFLGALLPQRLSFLDRVAVKVIGAPLKDLRDWRAIEAWAQSLPPALFATADAP